jgi:chromosome segregation ATPase
MKAKRFPILAVFAIIASLGVLFLLRAVSKTGPATKQIQSKDAEIAKLEEKIQHLSDLLRVSLLNSGSLDKEVIVQKELLRHGRQVRLELEAGLKEATAKNDKLNKQLELARSGLVDLEETAAPLREKLIRLGASLDTALIKTGQARRLAQQLQTINKGLDSIEQSFPNLIKENQSYRKEAQNLSRLLHNKEEESTALKKKSEQQAADKQELLNKINALSEGLKAIGREKSILQQKGMDLEKTIENLKQVNNSLDGDLSKLNKELKEAQSQQALLRKEKESALNQRDEVKRNLESEVKQKEEAIKRQKEQEEKINLLTQTNQVLERGHSALRTELGRLNKDYADVKAEQQKSKEFAKQSESELRERADKISDLQTKISAVENKRNEIQSKSQALEKEYAILKKQYGAIQLEREGLERQLEQSNLRLSDLQNQISATLELNADLQNRFQKMSNIFKAKQTTQAPAQEGQNTATKKVEVQLYPEDKTGAKDEK